MVIDVGKLQVRLCLASHYHRSTYEGDERSRDL